MHVAFIEIGFHLRGRLELGPGQGSWLDLGKERLNEIAAWLEEHVRECMLDLRRGTHPRTKRPWAALYLHPSAGPLMLSIEDRQHLVASAGTSSVGPGYHAFLCELLHRLGKKFGVAWDPPSEREGGYDPTGYFHTADRALLEDAMLSWLRTSVALTLAHHQIDGSPPMLSVPADRPVYLHGGALTTPMGPRDTAWIDAVLRDPRRGTDVFPWWHPGMAHYFLGRALSFLWLDARFSRSVSKDEDERILLMARGLLRAHELNPALDYPFGEMAEELATLRQPEEDVAREIRKRARSQRRHERRQRIGYRRGQVAVGLPGGFMQRVDGEFYLSEQEDFIYGQCENRLFSVKMWDASSRFSTPEWVEEDAALRAPLAFAYVGRRMAGRMILHAVKQDDEGRSIFMVGVTATSAGVALHNIFFRHIRDLSWALGLWRALVPPDSAEELYSDERPLRMYAPRSFIDLLTENREAGPGSEREQIITAELMILAARAPEASYGEEFFWVPYSFPGDSSR